MTFVLRNFEMVEKTDGFVNLPETLRLEVEKRRLGTNVYNVSGPECDSND